MNPLDRWTAQVAAELDLPAEAAEQVRLILDLARDVAHTVDRPAAPVTAYLLGLAVGRGAGTPAEVEQRIQALVQSWEK